MIKSHRKYSIFVFLLVLSLTFISSTLLSSITFAKSLNIPIGQKQANKISAISTSSVYNINKDQLIEIIQPIVEENREVQALKIIDTIGGETLLSFYRDNAELGKNKKIYNQEIPMSITKLDSYSSDITFENEIIGQVILYYQRENKINLSPQEQQWINSHTVKVGVEPWPPILYFEDNTAKGLSADILKKVADKTGLKLSYVSKSWDELLTDFKNKKIDLLPDTYFTEQRKEFGHFSKPFFTVRENIYLKKDNVSIHSLKDLSGKKLAIVKGYATIEGVHELFPEIEVIETNSFEKSVTLLLKGDVDALLDTPISSEYYFKEQGVFDIKGLPQFSIPGNKLHLFSRKNLPVLQSILDKGLAAISAEEKDNIINHWIANNKSVLNFNEQELNWIDDKKPIKFVYNSDWAPFEWVNDVGQYSGLVSDIIKLIEAKSGLNLIPLKTTSWQQATQLIKDRQADMYSAVGINAERKSYMTFSDETLFSTPYVLVSRNNEDYPNGLESFLAPNPNNAIKLALVENYTIHGLMKSQHPDVPLSLLKGTNEGFDKLLNKEIDVFLVNSVTAKHYIQQEKYKTLKITYQTDLLLNLHLAVRKDWPPEVISILNKTIASFKKTELLDIYEKWTNNQAGQTVDYQALNQQIKDISIIELLTIEELLFALFVIILLAYLIIQNYSRSKFLNLSFNRFIILIIGFEFMMIFFIIYELMILDRTENSLASLHLNEIQMLKGIDRLRQSSDDLTHFARSYAVTKNEKYKANYEQILAIRNGLQARPINYEGIYWDLDKKSRQQSHPDGNKVSLKSLFTQLPFIQAELNLLTRSENNSNGLVNTELKAFKAMEEGNQALAIKLLHSKQYYQYKSIIMQPIDNVLTSIKKRHSSTARLFEQKITSVFSIIIIASIVFILGNFLIYLMLVKKIKEPLQYLIEVIQQFKIGSKQIEEKSFYQDELGQLNLQFFAMKNEISLQMKKTEEQQQQLRRIHERTRESIEYASLIQHALVPDDRVFKRFFSDAFTIWEPKDIVGGDIYFAEQISEHELLIMLIDCTGHGVPGAFVTMLVKAIEQQVLANLNQQEEINPAQILSTFNQSIKKLLKQEDRHSPSNSNAGFDGGVLYVNKVHQQITFAGAKSPLYLIKSGQLEVIKGDRHSIGYKRSKMDYNFTNHRLNIEPNMQLYLSSDGFIDQNGGSQTYPMGDKRLLQLLQENHLLSMKEKKALLLSELEDYQEANERNDDVTMIGFKI